LKAPSRYRSAGERAVGHYASEEGRVAQSGGPLHPSAECLHPWPSPTRAGARPASGLQTGRELPPPPRGGHARMGGV